MNIIIGTCSAYTSSQWCCGRDVIPVLLFLDLCVFQKVCSLLAERDQGFIFNLWDRRVAWLSYCATTTVSIKLNTSTNIDETERLSDCELTSAERL